MSKAANAYLPLLVTGAATLSKSALTIIIRAPYEIMCVLVYFKVWISQLGKKNLKMTRGS